MYLRTTLLSILQQKLPAHMGIQGCTVFQHDGAPCHRAATVTRWLEEQNVSLLGPWPGSSPDLNPIENMWTLIKKRVSEKNPTSETSLVDIIKSVWATEVTQTYCEKLTSSMPSRIRAVLAAKGGHTKY